ETVDISHWFDTAVNGKKENAKSIANWMISELFAHPENWDVKNEKSGIIDEMRIITPGDLSELVDMLAENTINGKQAKEIFIKMLDGESSTPREIADKFGMKQMTDTGAIEAIIDEVIAANPSQVEQYKSGKVGLLGFFVGNVMKKTGGTANPAVVNEILRKKLS
ncbi:MAG: Asp-tRNA(Asn)/Glu-tRNA(Gln) amidotransferase GatCAB subunit B, partial [Alphaproteobacteria bacterium]|nr:Asp-tRNA(Asn)/Glu-tRNA(Gln) amidotransferase GatCAB subunit B [Alphaproteobacteria bacterium]